MLGNVLEQDGCAPRRQAECRALKCRTERERCQRERERCQRERERSRHTPHATHALVPRTKPSRAPSNIFCAQTNLAQGHFLR